MRIIEINALPNGAHKNQSWHQAFPPEGYAIVPDGLDTPKFPFGDATVEEINGVMTVTAWTPGARPEPEPEPDPEPSVWDELDAAYQEGVNDV